MRNFAQGAHWPQAAERLNSRDTEKLRKIHTCRQRRYYSNFLTNHAWHVIKFMCFMQKWISFLSSGARQRDGPVNFHGSYQRSKKVLSVKNKDSHRQINALSDDIRWKKVRPIKIRRHLCDRRNRRPSLPFIADVAGKCTYRRRRPF